MEQSKKEKIIRKYLEDCYGEFVDNYDTNDTEEHFTEGLEVAQKEFKKKLKDLYNAKNSQYKELTKPKLGRKEMTVYTIKLEAEVKLLQKLIEDVDKQ